MRRLGREVTNNIFLKYCANILAVQHKGYLDKVEISRHIVKTYTKIQNSIYNLGIALCAYSNIIP